MDESVGIRELQQHASKVVARISAGEEIVITERGRPVARMVPLRRTPVEDLTESGRLRPAVRPMARMPPLVEVAPDEPSASEILADLRADER